MDTNDARQAGFDADVVRDGLRFAMRMGLPGTQSERVTFFWNPDETFDNADVNGRPWDWTDSPSASTTKTDVPASLTMPVAVEFLSLGADSDITRVGDFDTPRLKITVLDEEYATLTDANLGLPDGVTVDGSTYEIEYWAPPVGLFDMTVHEAFAVARDES